MPWDSIWDGYLFSYVTRIAYRDVEINDLFCGALDVFLSVWYKMRRMTVEEKPVQLPLDPELQAMVAAGLHFGHKTSKTHPKMRQYVAGVRNAIHIIDLEQTRERMQEALNFIRTLKSEGKMLMLIGTKVQLKNFVKEVAEECQLPYVAERWIGGTVTNFGVVIKRIQRMRELEKMLAAGELEKYTKKEQSKFQREFRDLEAEFGGLKSMNALPAALFICDLDKNLLAAKEAKQKNIPVIAIVDTNMSPGLVDYVIPANDDAATSVKYILEKVKEAVLQTSVATTMIQ